MVKGYYEDMLINSEQHAKQNSEKFYKEISNHDAMVKKQRRDIDYQVMFIILETLKK